MKIYINNNMAKKTYIETAKSNYKQGKKPNIKRIIDYFLNLNISDTSKSVYISRFKKELKQIRDNPILDKLILPKELSEKVFNHQQKRISEKQNITIHKQSIDKLMSYETTNDFYKLALFLLLQCGRRLNEFLNLEITKGDNDHSLLFKGQLKSKTEKEYEIPLLSISFLKFKELYEKMIDLKPNKIHADTMNKKLRMVLKIVMDDDNIKIHDLRRLYAVLSYDKTDKTETIANYIQNVLGHTEPITSIYYNTIKILE